MIDIIDGPIQLALLLDNQLFIMIPQILLILLMLLSERIQLQLITHPYLHQLRTLNIVVLHRVKFLRKLLYGQSETPQLLVIIRVF